MQHFKTQLAHSLPLSLLYFNLKKKTFGVEKVSVGAKILIYFSCKYIKIRRGILKIVIIKEPNATDPK